MCNRRRSSRSMLAPVFLATCLLPVLAAAQGQMMFDTRGVSDKPQSKLWHHGNAWWACLNNSTTLAVYKLVANEWIHKRDLQAPVTPILKGGTCDALWDGTHLFVAVFDPIASQIYKLAYDAASDNFDLLAGFPVAIPMRAGAETIVIAKDSTGRLWVTYEGENKIWVHYTTAADHRTWSAALSIASPVETDDISSIVAYAGNRIGVLWTDQRNHRVCFKAHRDSDSPTSWRSTEVVISGFGVIDDHINVKADSQGRVYAVAKDYFDAVYVCRRDRDGTWTVTTGASGLDCGTRPILQIDEASNKLYVFYTRWAQCVSTGVHRIEQRVAYLDNLLFSLPTVIIGKANVSMNEVQGTKQLLPPGSLAVVCEGGGKAFWNGWGPVSGIGGSDPGGQFPPPPVAPSGLTGTTITEHPQPSLLLWRMDEGTGTKVADASGNNRTGTFATGMAAPNWIAGIMGKGLFFDRDYVIVPGDGLEFIETSFTLETWLRQDLTNSPGTGTIFIRGDTLQSNYQLTLKGDLVEFGWSANDSLDVSVKATGVLWDNAWHHIAAVYDHQARQARIYIDGKRKAIKSVQPPALRGNWKVHVGATVSGFLLDKTYAGSLDLLCITAGAKYSADFAPPLLYPSAPTNYARLEWSPVSSIAGIKGYRLLRVQSGKTPQELTAAPTPNLWCLDFGSPDGYITYTVRAVDGLNQQGSEASALVGFESYPPAIPSAPRGLAWQLGIGIAEGPAHWEMDEGHGDIARDGTARGHDARLGGPPAGDAAEPTWIASFSGKALRFDGKDDYVHIADAPDLRLAGSFTIECWMRRSKLGSQHALVSKEDGSAKRNFSVAVLSSNKVEFSWTRVGGSARKVTSTATLADMNWHHVACVYDAASGTSALYIDGQPSGSAATSGTPYTGPEPVILGARNASDWLQGELDLVRISTGVRYHGAFTPPTFYRGAARKHVAILGWGLPASGVVKEYVLYRQAPGGAPARIAALPASQPEYTDYDLAPQTVYRYSIAAMNSWYEEGAASEAIEVMLPEPTDTAEGAPAVPGPRLRLEPNPFNPQSTVHLRLERRGPVEVVLYDAAGHRVHTVVAGVLDAGEHRVPLFASRRPVRLASGVYFLRLRADGSEGHLKAVLVR